MIVGDDVSLHNNCAQLVAQQEDLLSSLYVQDIYTGMCCVFYEAGGNKILVER